MSGTAVRRVLHETGQRIKHASDAVRRPWDHHVLAVAERPIIHLRLPRMRIAVETLHLITFEQVGHAGVHLATGNAALPLVRIPERRTTVRPIRGRPPPAVHGLGAQRRPVAGLRAIETQTYFGARLRLLSVLGGGVVERFRHVRAEALHQLAAEEPSRLRRVTLQQLHACRLDRIQVHPRTAGVHEFEYLPPLLLVHEIKLRVMPREVLPNVRCSALVGRLTEARVHRVPRIRQFEHAPVHAGHATHHRVADLEHPATLRPNSRLVAKSEVHRISQLRTRRRGDRVYSTAVRQADETLTHLHQVAKVAVTNHGLQRTVHVRRLLLRIGEQLYQGGTPGHSHRVSRHVLVFETTAATPVGATVDLSTGRPTREDARAHRLETGDSRAERRLAQLLTADDLTATPHERTPLSRTRSIEHHIRLHTIEFNRVLQLPAHQNERLAKVEALRHHAMGRHPIGEQKPKGPRLRLHQHHPSSERTAHAPTETAPASHPSSPNSSASPHHRRRYANH